MGCQCAKSNLAQDKNELVKQPLDNHDVIKSSALEKVPETFNSNINTNKINMNVEDSVNQSKSKIRDVDYAERVFELINEITSDPRKYAATVKKGIDNIVIEKEVDKTTKEETGKTKIIYKKKIKVALTRGEPAFLEAIDQLSKMDPLPPLQFKKEICIPLPEIDLQIKDSNYLKEKVAEVQEHDKIEIFFKDLVKDPEVSTLLMIVDDNGKNAGKKRNTVLNPNYKYIGISSKFIKKAFVAYFAFSSE